MRIALLVGDPVSHSISPIIFNAAFAALGIDARYVAVRVPDQSLPATVAGLRGDSVLGANVTIPHKARVIDLLDEVSQGARAIGAVNTIVRKDDGMLAGHNTDAAGFLRPLHGRHLADSSVVVLGCGGAARAVVWALVNEHRPKLVTIAARSPAKAIGLVRDMTALESPTRFDIASFDSIGPAIEEASLVVNATPLGMHPDEDVSPWPDIGNFGGHQCVYDLVYRPRRTRLLRDATSQGAETIGGFEMLMEQAALSFELWTGQTFPRDAVQDVACRALDR